jgi:hypothetical protein
VDLDDADASEWWTAGDVFPSLLRALPPERRNADVAWAPFCEAICRETGVDPLKVRPETKLLGEPLREHLKNWLRRIFRPALKPGS